MEVLDEGSRHQVLLGLRDAQAVAGVLAAIGLPQRKLDDLPGLEPTDGFVGAIFPAGDSWIELWPEGPGMPAGTMLQVVVDDADAFASQAARNGLAPKGPMDAHGERIYFLKLPDGTQIVLPVQPSRECPLTSRSCTPLGSVLRRPGHCLSQPHIALHDEPRPAHVLRQAAAFVAMSLPAFGPLSTPRLVIRAVRHSDLDDLFEVNGDHEVTRFLPYATWQSRDDGVAWLTRMTSLVERGNARQLVVVRKDDDKVIGTLLLFNFDPASARLELGYVLGRAHWGRGLMREALQSVCAYAFGSLGIRRLEAEVHSGNVASIRLIRSLGFVHEGTLRKRWVAKDAAYDTDMYGLLSAEWPDPAADGPRTMSAAR